MRNYKELKIWQQAHHFVLIIYKVTEKYPKNEVYGLTSQIRRASVSISSNIVEGCGRKTNPDFLIFLQIAISSAYEVEYQLLLSKDLQFIDEKLYLELNDHLTSIIKMISSFIKNTEK